MKAILAHIFRIMPAVVLLAGIAASHAAGDKPLNFARLASPDGRYGVSIEDTEDADGIKMKEVNLVELKSGKTLCELETLGSQWAGGIRLLWTPDSRRLAFVYPGRRGDWTDLWVLKDGAFEKVGLPELPELEFKRDHYAKTVLASFSAVRWTKPDVLLLDNAVEDDEGHTAKMRVALRFGADNRVTVTRMDGKGR